MENTPPTDKEQCDNTLSVSAQAKQELDNFLRGSTFKVGDDLLHPKGLIHVEVRIVSDENDKYFLEYISGGFYHSYVLIPAENKASKKTFKIGERVRGKKIGANILIEKTEGESFFEEVLIVMKIFNSPPELAKEDSKPEQKADKASCTLEKNEQPGGIKSLIDAIRRRISKSRT